MNENLDDNSMLRVIYLAIYISLRSILGKSETAQVCKIKCSQYVY